MMPQSPRHVRCHLASTLTLAANPGASQTVLPSTRVPTEASPRDITGCLFQPEML